MYDYIYETHVLPDPLLPFIYYRDFQVTHQNPRLNWHENIELLWGTDGSGIQRSGVQDYPFSPGDVIVVNANTPHGIYSETCVHYRCLIIDNSFFAQNGIPVDTLRFTPRPQDPQLYQLLEAVAQAYEGTGTLRAAAIRSCVLAVILHLCRHHITHTVDAENTGAYVRSAVEYIRTHLAHTVTLDAVARHVGISKFHLCRLFKRFTGTTVIRMVQVLRCTEAQRLMEKGISVSAAAAACGFDNLSYFTRTFRSVMGRTPSGNYRIPKE